ncbi:MAG TPA: hypothetical protein VJP80_08000 [Candidatus Saccharimonadales bacterium]|nr:hypothetical protein [Candidatus Saccharimonadales bacterium]
MDQQKQAIVDRLKQSNNILVTVSSNPSVDQLAACLGLTLTLNKMGKHATAVFSGEVPSTIEFLQPEKTLEKNTDSLRDFIIALDKAKADKLRYKVEDKVVKIFITPYKTSISEKDLNFSQGDFNVDVVLALGVHNQQDLDQAITAHGRILHDAVVGTINVKPGGELGTLNWLETRASSLSELVAELVDAIDRNLMDGQMATALLTGIVAETKRFSNDKTSPMTMSISAELMAAGANQQLVATKLDNPPPPPREAVPMAQPTDATQQAEEAPKSDDGTLEISHEAAETTQSQQPAPALLPEAPRNDIEEEEASEPPAEMPQELPKEEPEKMPQIHIDEHGSLETFNDQKLPELPKAQGSIDPTEHMESQHMILEPPRMSGELTDMAAASPEDIERPSGDPLNLPRPSSGVVPLLGHEPLSVAPSALVPPLPGATAPTGTIQPMAVSAATMPLATPMVNTASMPAPSIIAPTVPAPPALTPTPAPEPPAPVVGPASVSPPAPLSGPATLSVPSTQSQVSQTLSDIEQQVHSPHLGMTDGTGLGGASGVTQASGPSATVGGPPAFPPAPAPIAMPPVAPSVPAQSDVPGGAANDQTSAAAASADLASAREAVMQAIASQPPAAPEPIQALNAQPLGAPLHANDAATTAAPAVGGGLTLPGTTGAGSDTSNSSPAPNAANSVPPVPPPMMPPQNY